MGPTTYHQMNQSEVFRIYSKELNRIESIIDKQFKLVLNQKDINNSINLISHKFRLKIANNIIESLK